MQQTQRRKNIRVFKLIFSVILMFSISVVFYIFNQYQKIENDEMKRINDKHSQRLTFSTDKLAAVIEGVDDIIKKLTTSPQIMKFTEQPSQSSRDTLENMFYFVAKNEAIYSQIRYINNDGIELIRVNNLGFQPLRVPTAQLQNKSQRPYFVYAKQLKQGEVGTWPVDLEIENGELSQPIQASMRIISPVYHQQKRQGFMVINLSISNMLSAIDGLHQDNVVTKIFEHQGHLLASDQPNETLDNLLHNKAGSSLAELMPNLWKQIQSSENGRLTQDDAVYSYARLSLGEAYSPLGQYIVISSPTDSPYVQQQKQHLLVNGLLILLLIAGICGYIFKLYNQHENELANSQLIEAAFNGVAGVIITNPQFALIKVNQEFVRVSGYTQKQLLNKSLYQLNLSLNEHQVAAIKIQLEKDDLWKGEIVGHNKSGLQYTLITRIQTLKNNIGQVKKYVITFIDITQRKLLEEELRNQSESDPLTGVWNRRKFDKELDNLTVYTKRYPDYQACLGIIDIDHFKVINDKHGHDAGDVALQKLAHFLNQQCRETDIVARIGGEEFAVLMPHTSAAQAEAVLNRLCRIIDANSQFPFTISGGVTKVKDDATLAYKHADIAMYRAKKAGRNQVIQYDATTTSNTQMRMTSSSKLSVV
ncbi:sensor domain-containing diguanylate cyclase [Shewanella japonica]|uniref:sensor domain-containing diguanylate cyclase n=1 Tax=Shewanella japonica TaxID=93973 RepID=UPI000E70B4D9|nr:sensor domain-containing diguanylate cyclase [Shewanella japonica]